VHSFDRETDAFPMSHQRRWKDGNKETIEKTWITCELFYSLAEVVLRNSLCSEVFDEILPNPQEKCAC